MNFLIEEDKICELVSFLFAPQRYKSFLIRETFSSMFFMSFRKYFLFYWKPMK